jgi:hypothetical protein
VADSQQTTIDERDSDVTAVAAEGSDGGSAVAQESRAGETDAAEQGGESTVAAGSGDGETGQKTVPAKANRWSKRRLFWTIGGVLAAIALGVCGFVTWQALNQDDKVLNQVAGTQTNPDPQNPGMVSYTDSETRMRISFPGAWATKRAGGADVRLVAGPGNGDLLSVRVVSLDTGTSGPPTPTSLKPYLDTIVNEPGVTMLQQNQIDMNHVPGWYYVYTFKDGPTGAQGIHAQYFAIRGNQLYSIVFQALPESDFQALAPVYQQIANSIQFY